MNHLNCNFTVIFIILILNGNYKRAHSMHESLAVNITRLLDRLLTNYSKSLRPTHELGKQNFKHCKLILILIKL